jgi:hypothetical protein
LFTVKMAEQTTYYYEQAGQQAGPVAANQLVAQGVTASTLVWCENMADWAAAETVPALRDLFAPIQLIPPQPAAPASAPAAKPTQPRMPPPTPTKSVFTGKNILIGLVVLLALGAEVASRAEPDTAEPEPIEQQDDAPAQVEEVKEIGYAAKHMHDEDAEVSREESSVDPPAASEPAQEDAIENVDDDNGWLTIHYERGDSRSLGVEKDWFFAYSPHLLVTHNDRVSCEVRDIYGNQITSGTTLNDGTCTGLRVVGDHIIIDVDTGHNTHQETYDEKLHLLRRSNVQMY